MQITRKPGNKCRKIRQVNGAGEVDVVVLFKDSDGCFWYQVPVSVGDTATSDLFGDFESEKEALDAGIRHLADIEGCSDEEYRRKMAAGE